MAVRVVNSHRFQAAINVTPFIDVLMVLLLSAFLTNPFLPSWSCGLDAGPTRGLSGRTARVSPKPVQDLSAQPNNVIFVAENGVIELNSQRVDRQSLPAKLAPSVRPGVPIFITASRNVEFREVAAVIDIARTAGAVEFALLPAGDRIPQK